MYSIIEPITSQALPSYAFAVEKILPRMHQVFSPHPSQYRCDSEAAAANQTDLQVSGLLLRVRRGVAAKHKPEETSEAFAVQVIPFAHSGNVYN